MSVTAGSFLLLAGATNAQDLNRVHVNVIPVSANETVSRSIANAAAQSSLPSDRQAQLSRQDLLNLMVLLSLPNNKTNKSF